MSEEVSYETPRWKKFDEQTDALREDLIDDEESLLVLKVTKEGVMSSIDGKVSQITYAIYEAAKKHPELIVGLQAVTAMLESKGYAFDNEE